MKENLYEKWIKEEITDLNVLLVYHGLIGVLEAFENWLIEKGHVVDN